MRPREHALATRACTGHAGAVVGTSAAEHQVGAAAEQRDETRQLGGVERGVGVAERRRSARPRPPTPGVRRRRRTRAAARRRPCAPALARDLGRAVRRAVVDDDRAVARRHARQHPRQRRCLVQAREHRRRPVGHHPTLGSVAASPSPAEVLRNAERLGDSRCRGELGGRTWDVIADAVAPLGNEDLVDRRVLVVEDDPTVREVVCEYLRAAGLHRGRGVRRLRARSRRRRGIPPDLDRARSDAARASTASRCAAASGARARRPIILLTALGSEEDRIAGLEAGADDYLTKPFSPRELVLRVQSVLRRSLDDFAPESAARSGPFHVDPAARVAMHARQSCLDLTVREFDLLAFLRQASAPGVQPRGAAAARCGAGPTATCRRSRCTSAGCGRRSSRTRPQPTLLTTVWGVGYRLDIGEDRR